MKPAHAGTREMVIVLQSTGLTDEHRVGEVDVHPNAEAARAAAPSAGEDAPGISFLKEQQWSLDFGTARRAGAGRARVDSRCRRGSRRDPAAPPTSSRRSTAG